MSHRLLIQTSSCLIDRTIPYLILRLKALWLTLLTMIFCLALTILFHWPKLQFNVCRMTFDTLPNELRSNIDIQAMKTLDIDITYYIGSKWETSSESFIPVRDIPTIDYNTENKMSSKPGEIPKFIDALQDNLIPLIQWCSSIQHRIDKRQVKYKHYYRHTSMSAMIDSK
jgi:hypothetical protein